MTNGLYHHAVCNVLRAELESLNKPANIVDLLAEWKKEGPLGPEDQFPEIEDPPPKLD